MLTEMLGSAVRPTFAQLTFLGTLDEVIHASVNGLWVTKLHLDAKKAKGMGSTCNTLVSHP